MVTLAVSVLVARPPEAVWPVVADVERCFMLAPNKRRLEFHGNQRTGVGTRFRVTRKYLGVEVGSEFEITEVREGTSITVVSESSSTRCAQTLTLVPTGPDTQLKVTADIASKAPSRIQRGATALAMCLARPWLRRAAQRELDLVRHHCEQDDRPR